MSPWQLFVDKAEPQEVQAVGHYWSPLLWAVSLPIFTARRTVILSQKIGSVKERDRRHKATAVRKQFLSNGDNLWPPVTVVSGITHTHRYTEEKRCRIRLSLHIALTILCDWRLESLLNSQVYLFEWTEINRWRTKALIPFWNECFAQSIFGNMIYVFCKCIVLYFSCSLAQMRSLIAPGHYMQKKQPTFCLTSPFMFHGRKQKKVIQNWYDMRVCKRVFFSFSGAISLQKCCESLWHFW